MSTTLVRTKFCWTLLLAVTFALSISGKTANGFGVETPPSPIDERPNVVIFLSDDQGLGDFSFTGNQDLNTPSIDSLAKRGAYVENFFVCPVCSPTRAEFLTGRYSARGGVFSTSTGGERLDLDEATIAESFQAAGYKTAAFGKWHNGMQPPYHPICRGFGEYYGFCSGHWGHYFSPMLDHNNSITRGNGFVIDDFTTHAIEFIEQNQKEPFFVYLPYCTPHSPMQVPDPFWDKFKDKTISQPSSNPKREVLSHTRSALAMCENIDHNVGRVLKKLDELKLTDNTIVIYFCDNGPNGWRYNLGLKGKKGSTDEGGVRSPLFVQWPKKIPAGTCVKNIAGAIDLFPTLADLCGVEPKNVKPFDGVSIADELQGEAVNRERMIFSFWRKRLSVRTNQYRLDEKGKLFDIVADPNQTAPINNKPKVKQELMAAAEKFHKDVASQLNTSAKPFSVGHSKHKLTQMPARDAVASGKIERSSRHPNCSFFRKWTRTEDDIRWQVDVLTAGTYEAEIYYCLDPKNVGTVVELASGDEKVQLKISEAHQSELIGEAQDRSPRTEAYVKNFKPVSMGQLKLAAGTSELILRAKEIPGDESIEFRLLLLKRID